MKLRLMLATAMLATVALVVGCSSSSSDGGNATPPTCKGATGSAGPGSSACNSCTQSSCGSQISAIESECSAYVSCYEGCDCSNLTCIAGCQSQIDSACMNAYNPFTSCLVQNCTSQCVGSTGSDGG
jgi:hypothetical protein